MKRKEIQQQQKKERKNKSKKKEKTRVRYNKQKEIFAAKVRVHFGVKFLQCSKVVNNFPINFCLKNLNLQNLVFVLEILLYPLIRVKDEYNTNNFFQYKNKVKQNIKVK